MSYKKYIESLNAMNQLAITSSKDELSRYAKSDIFWAERKQSMLSVRTVHKGEVYQFEFGKNFMPEMSYEHRGLVIGVADKLLYVLPICSFRPDNKEHARAFHPISNLNMRSNFYLLKSEEYQFLKHDSVLKLNDLKTVSTKRILYMHGAVDNQSEEYLRIERMAFRKCFPQYSYAYDKMREENNLLYKELEQYRNCAKT